MGKIADAIITKVRTNTESSYHYIIARYIAPFFTLSLKRLGCSSPNFITLLSFILILTAGMLVLKSALLGDVYYRIAVAVLIQLSFILDCSDGQLARITNKTSKLGAWIDRILDRVGEFTIFTIFGITAWKQTGSVLFLFLGIVTGYTLSAFTLSMTLSDSSIMGNLEKVIDVKKKKSQRNEPSITTEKRLKDTRFVAIITRVFFFLNFGIGERYLYLSFFLILNRIDIMLYISAFLTTLRFLSISFYVGKKLKKTDRSIRELDG